MNETVTPKKAALFVLGLFTFAVLAMICAAIFYALYSQARSVPISTEFDFEVVSPGTEMIMGRAYFDSLTDIDILWCTQNPTSEGRIVDCSIDVTGTDEAVGVKILNIADDSVGETKTVYLFQKTSTGWTITAKEERHSCREGRGDTSWHNKSCV